ncbi:MAG: RNA methyltransferase [Geminicoccaceae bacterium]|nr:RNA methyltransferase [Geminicoccaceae bacterium]
MDGKATLDGRRGWFAIGAENISKPMNLGNLVRSAHAFGAAFVFLIDAHYTARASRSDTSDAAAQLPVYDVADVGALHLPRNCALVGVELVDEAVPLPSFRHPRTAAYVFGPERGSLSPAMLARCDHVVRIPTRFCINLAVAGAIVMYDRLVSSRQFADRPIGTASVQPLRRNASSGDCAPADTCGR